MAAEPEPVVVLEPELLLPDEPDVDVLLVVVPSVPLETALGARFAVALAAPAL